jgi:hypothetical protein
VGKYLSNESESKRQQSSRTTGRHDITPPFATVCSSTFFECSYTTRFHKWPRVDAAITQGADFVLVNDLEHQINPPPNFVGQQYIKTMLLRAERGFQYASMQLYHMRVHSWEASPVMHRWMNAWGENERFLDLLTILMIRRNPSAPLHPSLVSIVNMIRITPRSRIRFF